MREHHLEWPCAPWHDAAQHLHWLQVTSTPAAAAEVAAVALPSHRDCFGNQVHRGALLGAHHSLVLQMDAVVETDLDGPLCCDDVEPARERAWIDASLRQAPRLWIWCCSAMPPRRCSTP